MIVPATLTRDLGRFDCCDFAEMPKWVIMRNETGLQVQLFWEAKKPVDNEKNSITKKLTTQKRSKRKRSPQKIVQSSYEMSPSRFVKTKAVKISKKSYLEILLITTNHPIT
jgi:hypothetical protein